MDRRPIADLARNRDAADPALDRSQKRQLRRARAVLRSSAEEGLCRAHRSCFSRQRFWCPVAGHQGGNQAIGLGCDHQFHPFASDNPDQVQAKPLGSILRPERGPGPCRGRVSAQGEALSTGRSGRRARRDRDRRLRHPFPRAVPEVPRRDPLVAAVGGRRVSRTGSGQRCLGRPRGGAGVSIAA